MIFGLVAGLAMGLMVGLAAGLVGGLVVGLRTTAPQTTQTIVRTPGRLKKFGSYFASGLIFGVGSGLVVDLHAGLGAGLAIGIVTGLLAGLAVRLIGGLGEWAVTAPADEVASRSPESLLRSTRTGAGGQTLFAGLGTAIGTGVGAGLMVGPGAGLIVGLAGRPSDGLITFVSGTLGGVVNLLTAPWAPERDWQDYKAMIDGSSRRTSVDVALSPLADGARVALRLQW